LKIIIQFTIVSFTGWVSHYSHLALGRLDLYNRNNHVVITWPKLGNVVCNSQKLFKVSPHNQLSVKSKIKSGKNLFFLAWITTTPNCLWSISQQQADFTLFQTFASFSHLDWHLFNRGFRHLALNYLSFAVVTYQSFNWILFLNGSFFAFFLWSAIAWSQGETEYNVYKNTLNTTPCSVQAVVW